MILVIICFCFLEQTSLLQSVYSQNLFKFNKNDFSSLSLIESQTKNVFEIKFSLVAMFTAGSIIRDGFRLGAGISCSQQIGDWKITTGLDVYKEKDAFEPGIFFVGFGYDDGIYGVNYYCTRYFQGGKQFSGLLGLRLRDFELRFEDDILALPFTGFVLHDRYRTAGLEFRFRNFLLGTNVYTNESNGLTVASTDNALGTYYVGKQLSSPVYVGHARKGLLIRSGINHPFGGFLGQNGWHRFLFQTSDFQPGNYSEFFMQLGVDKPYTLY